jgi:predicted ATPase
MASLEPQSGQGALRLRSPLVGRRAEVSMLEDALTETIERRAPHAITVMGSPGVGKTRLVREFIADLHARDDSVSVYTGHSREGGPAFGAIRSLLRARLGLHEGLQGDALEAQFRSAVSSIIGDQRVGEFLHFLGAFLDIELPDSPFIRAMGADQEQLRQIGRTVLRRFLELDAAQQPLVLVLEDFHWAQEESLGLVRYLIESLGDAPVLFIVVARPTLLSRYPEWGELKGNAMRFDLAPLDQDDAAEMIQHLLAPAGNAPGALVDTAVELAGGSPYLLEQLVRTYMDNGIIEVEPDGRWTIDLSNLDETELPLSIEDAINARIGALHTAERSLLEMAATVGGVFWLGALVALERFTASPPEYWNDPDADRRRIAALLDELSDRDYVMTVPDSAIAGETEYVFKHNLERESLRRYTSKSLLTRYHLAIAQWLEFRLGDESEEQHELLAQHFEKGGAPERAAHHYLRAADRARLRYAATRAAEYYAVGLNLLGAANSARRLDALQHFGEVLQLAGRNSEALSTFEEMRAQAYQLDLKDRAGIAHERIGRVRRDLGHLSRAMQHLDTANALCEAAGDERGAATTLDAMAMIHSLRGNGDAAEHMIKEALDTMERLGDRAAVARCHHNLGIVYRDSLRLDAALDSFRRALTLRQELQDAQGVAESLTLMGVVQDHMGNGDQAATLWREALAAAESRGDRVRQAVVLTCLGGSAYRRGEAKQAVKMLEQADALARTLGDRLQEADTLRSLAKARALIGDLAGAFGDVSRAIAIFEQAESKPQLGVALRTLGEIAAAGRFEGRPDDLQAEHLFDRSMKVLKEVGHDVELAHTCFAYAEHVGHGMAEHADGRERAVWAEQMRHYGQELLERRKGFSIRPSRVPRV